MDKNIRIAVALTICHIVSGRSHFPHRHEEYHGYDYPVPAWDRFPDHYHREQKNLYPHKHVHNDKLWKPDRSAEWESGSWESPEFHGHGNPNLWGNHGCGSHEKPNQWHHHPPGAPWHNKPSWDHNGPNPNQNKPSWNQNGPVTSSPVQQPQTSPRGTTGGSQDTLAIKLCIRSCPVTSEFNPVCGSNNVTYSNPGRLECAKYCGVAVTLQRNAPCPPPGASNTNSQTQTPVRPTQPTRPTLKPINPTRFTTVEVPPTQATDRPATVATNPPFTISPEILNNIFTSPTTEGDEDAEIDIRTRNRFPPYAI